MQNSLTVSEKKLNAEKEFPQKYLARYVSVLFAAIIGLIYGATLLLLGFYYHMLPIDPQRALIHGAPAFLAGVLPLIILFRGGKKLSNPGNYKFEEAQKTSTIFVLMATVLVVGIGLSILTFATSN